MSRIFTAVALCLIIPMGDSALADGSVSQTGLGGGGRFGPFDAIVSQYNASGERFRIDSHCQSACTLFLAIRNVCITPSADLAFHAGGHPQIKQSATDHMMAAYKPQLRRYLQAGHYMEAKAFHTISGRDMIAKFGYRACK
jgi:hypothetical protein